MTDEDETEAKTDDAATEAKPKPEPEPNDKPDDKSVKADKADKAKADKADAKADKAAVKRKARQPDAWDEIGAWLAKYGALPALGAITIAVFALHFHVFSGESAGDDLSFHFAESARIADCIRHLDFDWWNPSANGGYASAYYYQIIPQLASALPTAIFGHHLFFFQLSIVLPLVLAPAAAYRGMRLLGASPWQAAVAAFCVAFMNGESRWGSGNAGTFMVGLYTQTWALCAFPLALGHGARWITDGKGLGGSIAWAGFVFLCHPFAGISLGVALVIAFFARFIATWRLWESPTFLGVLALYAGGIPVIAVGLLAAIPNAPSAPAPGVIAGVGVAIAACGAALIGVTHANDRAWHHPTVQRLVRELHRLAILGGAMIITTAPVMIPLTVDSDGFGGFPHRVADEIGPGFGGLWKWYSSGAILDFMPPALDKMRIAWLTYLLPLIVAFTLWKRAPLNRWLWTPALLFAILLGLGPHIGKIGDDLFPPVRALGAMQTVIAMGIGAGVVSLGQWLWNAPWDDWIAWLSRPGGVPKKGDKKKAKKKKAAPEPGADVTPTVYAARTGIVTVGLVLAALFCVPGWTALRARVRIMEDDNNDGHGHVISNNHSQLVEISDLLAKLPQGRKQGGPGTENHWWNLLTYEYSRTPAVLQMGGGGLQASPNYDFLWTMRDTKKNAWIYDAPYLVFASRAAAKMPAGETIARTRDYELRRLPAPGLVSPAQVVGVLPPWYRPGQLGHLFALEWDKSDMPLNDQILAYAGSGTAGPPPAGHTVRAWRQDSPGNDADIVAEIDDTGPTTYWVHESWHPRWHAYVDGTEVPVRRVTPDFMAVDAGAGKHTIELRFERPTWAWLVWLAWPLPVLIGWLLTRRRPAASAPPA